VYSLIDYLDGGGQPFDVDSFLDVVGSSPVAGCVGGSENLVALQVKILYVRRLFHG